MSDRASYSDKSERPGLRFALTRDIRRTLDPLGRTTLTPWRVTNIVLWSPELRLVIAFRLYSWIAEHVNWYLGNVMYAIARGRMACDLQLGATIGPGLRIEHRADVVVGGSAVLGSDIDLYNGVTVGKRRPPWDEVQPTIGDRVMLGAGAKILGGITVGDDVVVAANAVVLDDVPDGAAVAGIPARQVGRGSRRWR
ncbi:MAG: hypothetical protein JO130_11345 [Solirubrobacterales bacterium]|nr:hypothetical protein [Solirubrobacterales bacterium]